MFLWLQAEPERLGADALESLGETANDLLLSAVSSWELAIKVGLGRLSLPEPVERWVPSRAGASGVTLVPIDHRAALAVASLPPLHRDPFDRLLVAQAGTLGATIVTADDAVLAYGAPAIRVG